MIWGLLSLLASILYAAQSEANKKIKMDGFKLSTYRALLSFLILSPCVLYMEWPRYPEYYLFIIASASIQVLGLMAQYNLASKHSGRIMCLHQPISIAIVFGIWLLLNETQLEFLQNNPNLLASIVGAFLMFTVSLQYIRKGNYGVNILLSILPMAILGAMITVVSKVVLEKGNTLLGISLNFVFLSNIIVFLLSIPVMMMLHKKNLFDKKTIARAIPVSIYHAVAWVFMCLALILTANPAYPTLLLSLTPLWFMIYYKIKEIKDNSNPVAGAFLGLSAIILLLATAA